MVDQQQHLGSGLHGMLTIGGMAVRRRRLTGRGDIIVCRSRAGGVTMSGRKSFRF
jgi:hypothetical protein